MKTNTAEKYIETRDENGDAYLCPISDEPGDNNASRITGDECFEKDVLERYSGNIDIVGRDG
jgi:hypothetical protein